MAIRGKRAADGAAGQIHFDDGAVGPQADECRFAAGRRNDRVGITAFRQGNVPHGLRTVERHQAERVSPAASDQQRFAVGGERQAGRDLRFVDRSHGERFVIEQSACLELPSVYDFRLAAAGVQVFARRIEGQAVERLRHDRPRDHLVRLQIDNHHLVVAIAGAEHRRPLAAGVDRDVDREVADLELLSRRSERPLRGQQDVALRLQSGQDSRGRRSVDGRGRLRSDCGCHERGQDAIAKDKGQKAHDGC